MPKTAAARPVDELSYEAAFAELEQVVAALHQNAHAVAPEQNREDNEIGFAQVVGLEGDGAVGMFLSKTLEALEAERGELRRGAALRRPGLRALQRAGRLRPRVPAVPGGWCA